MIIGGLDFETTGRDVETHSIVEVGIVLWCTDLHRPVRSSGFLVYQPNAVWEDGATEVNGITQEMCKAYGVDADVALKRVIQLYRQADVMCTHNGTIFDRPFYEQWCTNLGFAEWRDQGKVWIDTKIDLPIPSGWSTKLKYLALEHGIWHYKAHGALPDATVMLEILDKYSLHTVMESAQSPTVIVQALVPYADKDKAKARGYYWRPNEKQWVKSMKAYRVPDEATQADFPIKIIKK